MCEVEKKRRAAPRRASLVMCRAGWDGTAVRLVWSFMCCVKLRWRTPTGLHRICSLREVRCLHHPIQFPKEPLVSSTPMTKEAGRFETGIQPHGKANGRIHIWLLDSRDCPSMCFHGSSISLSTVVILLVYDQCLQTPGRLKLHLATLKIFRCSYFSAVTQDQKGKNIGQANKFHQILPYPKQMFILLNTGMYD